MVIQVIVCGFGGDKKTIDLCEDEKELRNITVLNLKMKIAGKFSAISENTVGDLQMVFSGKRLDQNSKALSEYGIKALVCYTNGDVS